MLALSYYTIACFFLHFCCSLSQLNGCIYHLFCSGKRTLTHTYSSTCLPVKLSDVWSCFAWFRRRARGEKPLHLNSLISCSQSKKVCVVGGAREIKVEYRKRERAVGTVTYIFCRALFSAGFSTTWHCVHLQLFLPLIKNDRPAWVRLGLEHTEVVFCIL